MPGDEPRHGKPKKVSLLTSQHFECSIFFSRNQKKKKWPSVIFMKINPNIEGFLVASLVRGLFLPTQHTLCNKLSTLFELTQASIFFNLLQRVLKRRSKHTLENIFSYLCQGFLVTGEFFLIKLKKILFHLRFNEQFR